MSTSTTSRSARSGGHLGHALPTDPESDHSAALTAASSCILSRKTSLAAGGVALIGGAASRIQGALLAANLTTRLAMPGRTRMLTA